MKLSLVVIFFVLTFLAVINLSSALDPNLGKTVAELRLQEQDKIIAATTQRKIVFWEGVVNKNPDFRDAYLQLSLLSLRVGRSFDAKKFYELGWKLDPNYEGSKNLKKVLTPIP